MPRISLTLAALLALVAAAPASAQPMEALLIQNSAPWGANAWQSELIAAGIPFDQVRYSDVANPKLVQ